MNDHQAWERGARLMAALHDRLPHGVRQQLGTVLADYRRHKGEMLALTLATGSGGICRACGGQCCQNGKYRFSGLDFLSLLEQQTPVPAPDFARKPFCPYGDADGCRMAAPFRPLDCVLFICDAIADRLEEPATHALARLEQELRQGVRRAEALLGQRLGQPLLLLAEHPDGTDLPRR
ncbi:hypothetical protein FO488_01665 [Geobacter sp. FeAm09]|uniref:hypothetical protein n=1 Tax=Geobacter sp. FeAm09 TaxID=2597769 RepID=UPI0011EFA71C|nr:hypothetical protein [Geobacter sp. FeAm09]QEM66991.1 hypothetical protein FO488_01665 [Geobacter sp. FeAm09]